MYSKHFGESHFGTILRFELLRRPFASAEAIADSECGSWAGRQLGREAGKQKKGPAMVPRAR